MKALIVYWHPEPKSFNGAMFTTARETLAASGHEVVTSDLHAMAFNPVSGRENFTSVKDPGYFKQQIEEMRASEVHGFAPDIEREIGKLEWCDFMLWQFPLWWFGLPAVFKGWVDRVFAMGRVYGGGRIYETGVFKGKRAMVSITTGGPYDSYIPGGFNGDMGGVLRPIHRGMLAFVGFDVLSPQIVYGPVRMTDEERKRELADYARRLRHIESEAPVDVGAY